MHRITLCLVLALGLAGLAACGRDEGPKEPIADLIDRLYVVDAEELDRLLAEVGVRGRTEPAVVTELVRRLRHERVDALKDTIRFDLDLAAIQASGRDPTMALRQVTEVLARRLATYGYTNAHFDQSASDGTITMGVPRRNVGENPTPERMAAEARYLDVMIRRLTRRGTVELLVEAEPPAEGQIPPSLWTGNRKSFDEFVRAEAIKLEKAAASGSIYEPSRPDFILAHLRPSFKEAKVGLVVLHREAEVSQQFERGSFKVDPATLDGEDLYVFALSVAEARVADMGAWSKRHVGRRIALVIDGRAEVLLQVGEPVTKTLIMPLGPRSEPLVRPWMEGVLNAIASDALPFPVVGRIANEVPPTIVTPAMRALAEIGTEAAEAVLALRAEGGNIGARAVRTLELIGRTQTGNRGK